MKRFIRNIAIFGIVLLAILLIEDTLTTYAFHKKTTRKYGVWNDIIHSHIDANVLIMGNSRAWSQYSPRILDSVLGTYTYNIGIDGSCFNRQLARYDIYRHYQMSAPCYIIQNLEFFTLGHTEGYEREQFMPFLMYPYFRKRICEIEPFSFGELFIPMYRYYINNVYDEYTKYDFPLVKGYYCEDITWDESTTKEIVPYRQEVDTNTIHLFTDFIKDVQREDIKLIFVIAPLYKDATCNVLNLEEIHSIFYKLSEDYNIPILDYANCWLSQDTMYFKNTTHLNKTGAELFSIKLAQDLDSLGIIPKQKCSKKRMIKI